VTGSGKTAVRLLPWVHTLIANVKGNIRGVYHGVSDKHLPLYLAEFCYRLNRRFWETQMFNRMITARLNAQTLTFSELRQEAFCLIETLNQGLAPDSGKFLYLFELSFNPVIGHSQTCL
jgi:hypothetical protein